LAAPALHVHNAAFPHAAGAAELLPALDDIADPDRVGPCPQAGLPAVIRRGRDSDGRDTWWHVDGSLTKRGWREVAGAPVQVVTRVEAPNKQLAGHTTPASLPSDAGATR
jgi:hypothetical protein